MPSTSSTRRHARGLCSRTELAAVHFASESSVGALSLCNAPANRFTAHDAANVTCESCHKMLRERVAQFRKQANELEAKLDRRGRGN
jgi:hypothetical protein